MKLQVNFDLLSKIATSKTGLTLDKTMKQAVANTLIVETICLPLQISISYTKEQFLLSLLRLITLQISILGLSDIIVSKWQKQMAVAQLKILAYILSTININTDYDLLIQSYKYQTNYKWEFHHSKLPKLKQEKYIMVPVYENEEEKEVSVLQEHIIGSKNYELSIGEPTTQRRLKLVHDSI